MNPYTGSLFPSERPREREVLPLGIRVGTSGYDFRDWVDAFYPRGLRKDQHLEFYAEEFDCLEVNTTYYGVPKAHVLERMADRTPEDFAFVVKANAVHTHDRAEDAALDDAYRAACAPLVRAGKYRGTIAQFPWSFRNTDDGWDYLRSLRARLPDGPVFVEFRHVSWADASTYERLREAGLAFVVVDAPRIASLMPAVEEITAADAYVRLHGRNGRDWWRSAAGSDRYNYDYSPVELSEWGARIRTLAARASRTYVFFNNCHAGQAARNAKLLKRLLAAPST